MENIGLRIYELRKAKGLTQEELAIRMGGGTNKSMVSKWENGISLPGLAGAKRLSDALTCSLDFLITGTDKHIIKFYPPKIDTKSCSELSMKLQAIRESVIALNTAMISLNEAVQSLGDTRIDICLTGSDITCPSKNN